MLICDLTHNLWFRPSVTWHSTRDSNM